MKKSVSKFKGLLALLVLLLVSSFALSLSVSAVSVLPDVTVTYEAAGRGGISWPYSTTIKNGGAPTYVPKANPFKECFFTGWADESGNIVDPTAIAVTKNATYTATFGEPHKVKYLSQGSGSISGPQTINVQPGGTPHAIPTVNPFKECFFTGWVDEAGNPVEPTEVVITEDRVFYATFGDPYKVKYLSQGSGSISGQQTINVSPGGTPSAVPTAYPFKDCFFIGWVDEAGNPIEPTEVVINEDRIFYATFGNPYKVKFLSVGSGSISGPQTINVQPGETPHTLPITKPFTNYAFLGWLDEDGNDIEPTEVVINEDRVFYAAFGDMPTSN